MKIGYLATGRMGRTIRLLNPNKSPRSQLLEKCYRKHADNIFQDKKDGSTVITGYIVAKEWFIIEELHTWEKSR